MSESRNSYGYSTTNLITPDKDMQKWMIAYRTKDGGYGEIGFLPLFKTENEAMKKALELQKDREYMSEIIIKHPAKMYSGY